MSFEAPTEEPGRVEEYAMKIPPYWTSDPKIWFVQVKAQFAVRGITAQRTMYHHVVGSLSPEIAMEISNLLLKPPEDHAYDVLKQKLTERTAASEQCQLQQLFMTEELGDRKPTQLLRHECRNCVVKKQ